MKLLETARQLGRRSILPVMYRAGIPALMTRLYGDSLTIACYHGVTISGSMPYSGRHLPATTFRRHLRFYRRHFNVVSLARMFELVERNEPVDKPTLAITFDDGYANNLEIALPILEEFDCPATVFLSTIVFEAANHIIYADVLDILRIHGPPSGIVVDGVTYRRGRGRDMVSETGASLYERLVECMPNERDRIVDQLLERYDVRSIIDKEKIQYWRLLDSTGVVRLDNHPLVDVEAHGHGHYLLDKIPRGDAEADLIRCKTLFREKLDRDPEVLAFPAGSYTRQTIELARKLGFRYLLAERYKTPDDGDDPHLLERVSISGSTNYYSNILNYAFSLRRSNRIKQ
ncbi:MAG: polysaccharide deacetylase family protein [Rhodothermales bacterium]|nr:polysaccharide deacetylase family protein [Rhodothermales bacterium]